MRVAERANLPDRSFATSLLELEVLSVHLLLVGIEPEAPSRQGVEAVVWSPNTALSLVGAGPFVDAA